MYFSLRTIQSERRTSSISSMNGYRCKVVDHRSLTTYAPAWRGIVTQLTALRKVARRGGHRTVRDRIGTTGRPRPPHLVASAHDQLIPASYLLTECLYL